VGDAQLAGAVGDTQNTPATDDKGDTQVGVAGAAQDSMDSTRGGGFPALLAMDHCHVDVELRCTPDNHTVRLVAATVDEKKLIDETTAGDLDGTRVLGVVDNPIRGSMRVHRKEGKVQEEEDPWRGEDVCLPGIQALELLEASSSLC